jgi:type IV secretion system protein VirB5
VISLLAFARSAHAQWAVIDVQAVAQLLQEVQTMQQQLATARSQLQQAQQQLQAMTGDRGMEQLLAGISRNYLPANWGQLQGLLSQAPTSFASLGGAMQSSIAASAVLTPQQLAMLAPAFQGVLMSGRRSTALLQAIVADALSTTSARFSALQQLIDAIGSAGDQKAVLDLQARITAEQGMLQNEQTKLGVLYEAAQAQEWVDRQRAREQLIAGHGSFAARFQPVP